MPALVAANVTITIPVAYARRIDDSGRRRVFGTLAFGDGALTYPTGGIPMPAIGNFDMRVVMQQLNIIGNNATTNEYVPMWNKTTNKLVLYDEEVVAAGGPLLEALSSEAPTARLYDFEAVGW